MFRLFGGRKRGLRQGGAVPPVAAAPPAAAPSKAVPAMASEGLHAARESLSDTTYHLHQAISSLMEELEAADWYRQRADDCKNEELRPFSCTIAREIEHSAMLIEWLRRNSPHFDKELREYLFTEGDLAKREEEVMGKH